MCKWAFLLILILVPCLASIGLACDHTYEVVETTGGL